MSSRAHNLAATHLRMVNGDGRDVYDGSSTLKSAAILENLCAAGAYVHQRGDGGKEDVEKAGHV